MYVVAYTVIQPNIIYVYQRTIIYIYITVTYTVRSRSRKMTRFLYNIHSYLTIIFRVRVIIISLGA
jgi:hypothetical protein